MGEIIALEALKLHLVTGLEIVIRLHVFRQQLRRRLVQEAICQLAKLDGVEAGNVHSGEAREGEELSQTPFRFKIIERNLVAHAP